MEDIKNMKERMKHRTRIENFYSEKVQHQGIKKSNLWELSMCLAGIARKEDLQGIIGRDLAMVERIRDECVQQGTFYEFVRREIFARLSGIRELDYDDMQWSKEEQEHLREEYFTAWSNSRSDVDAMMYTLACMPLPSWHYRLYLLLVQDGGIISPTPQLYDMACKVASRKGEDSVTCCEQGLQYMAKENSLQISAREKADTEFWESQTEEDIWGMDDEEMPKEVSEWCTLYDSAFKWEK